MTFDDVQALMGQHDTHVLSIRRGKRGWIVNVRETDTRWAQPRDKEYPSVEAALRAYYRLPETPDDELEDLLG